MTKLRKQTCLKANLPQEKNKYVICRLMVGPCSKKLCPQAWICCPLPAASVSIFNETRSRFFTIQTSQPANNIYLFHSFSRSLSQCWVKCPDCPIHVCSWNYFRSNTEYFVRSFFIHITCILVLPYNSCNSDCDYYDGLKVFIYYSEPIHLVTNRQQKSGCILRVAMLKST